MSTFLIAAMVLIAVAAVFGVAFALYQFSTLSKMELQSKLEYETVRIEALKLTQITK